MLSTIKGTAITYSSCGHLHKTAQEDGELDWKKEGSEAYEKG